MEIFYLFPFPASFGHPLTSIATKGICGMSVVKDWEELKKFNLAQLQGDREEKGTSKAEADQKAEKGRVT